MTTLERRELAGFEIHERIGAGGFGEVYRATQTSVGRDVAIKVVLPTLANDPDFVRRFEIEAHLVASLEHPHITPLYDYWRDPDGAYLVMRYYPRGSLHDAIAREGAFSPETASRLIDQIAAALDLAHRNGIVHRDIKPSNVLLDADGNAVLSDFGIAKSSSPRADGLTREGMMIGSPDYLAPEQARGQSVAAQSDIYSLGVLLHELLSGRHPFHDSDPVQRLARHLNDPLPPLEAVPDDLREDLDAVIERATAKEPTARFATAGALATALRDALVRARDVGAADDIVPPPPPTPPTLTGEAARAIANPFVGLRAFRSADAAHFHGRERLVQELLDHIGGPDGRLLALVGPSGSGKSSVVHAGVLPALREGAVATSETWFVTSLVPGSRPLDEIEVALMRVATQASPSLREHLTRDANGLVRAAQIVLPDDDSELVLAIDQFEELFTVTDDDATRRHVLDLLHAAATDPRSRVRVVLTLRADFFDRPLQIAPFADVLRTRVTTIAPMNEDELQRAIVRPAHDAGLRFDDGLVERMIAEVRRQPGALPLLQFALTRLYEKRDGARLTSAAFDAIGGVGGALARRAEELYQASDPAEQEATRQLALRLVALGEGTEDTRRRALLGEVRALTDDPELLDGIVARLTDERLLTSDHDPATREPTIEFAHEALLREWDRLRSWIDDGRSDVRMQRQLADLARAWSEGDREASYLLRGRRLDLFDAWRRETQLALAPLEAAYVDASLEQRDHERRLEAERQARAEALRRRARSVVNALVVVLLVATVASGGLGLWANQQRRIAEDQREAAEAERRAANEARAQAEEAEAVAEQRSAVLLAAQAETQAAAGHGDRAVLLALEAMRIAPDAPETERALANAVSETHALGRFADHELGVTGVSWSPDGTRIASASQDNRVLIRDADDGTLVRELVHPTGISRNVVDYTLATAWSPDGATVYTLAGDRFTTGSQDHHLFAWDAASGERLAMVEVPNAAEPENGRGVAESMERFFTGDGLDVNPVDGTVASLGGDDTAVVWRADLSAPVRTLRGHTGDVTAVAFSPDGAFLATASHDGTARIWDVATGLEVHALVGHEGWVRTVTWSPDGRLLATGGDDGTIRIWSVADGRSERAFPSPSGVVEVLAWSRSDDRIVAVIGEIDLRAFDPDSGRESDVFAGHEKVPSHIAFSPDGARFASSAMDPAVRIWSTRPIHEVVALPYVNTDAVEWWPDGGRVTVPGIRLDGRMELAVWDADARRAITDHLDASRHDYYLQGDVLPGTDRMAVSSIPDFPAMWQSGAPVRLIDVRTGETIAAHDLSDGGATRTIDVAPDGSRFVTGSNRQAVDVWDGATGAPVWSAEHEPGAFVTDIAWSPDGRRIASVGDADGLRIWDAATGDAIAAYPIRPDVGLAWQVAWAPDSERLLLTYGGGEGFQGTGTGAEIIDMTGAVRMRFDGHAGDVTFGAWNPAGTRIVTNGTDNSVRIWDVATGAELARFDTHIDFNAQSPWSPRGDLLFIGAHGQPVARIVRIWNDREELLAYADACCVIRELSDAERRRFGLDDPAPSPSAEAARP